MLDEFNSEFISQTPDFTDDELQIILKCEFGILKVKITRLTGYDDLNFRLEDFEFADENCFLRQQLINIYGSLKAAKSIIKFSCPIEARVLNLMNAQVALIDTLKQNGIPCAEFLKFSDGSIFKVILIRDENGEVIPTPLRMFSFLPGDTLEKFCNDNPESNYFEIIALTAQLLAKFHNTTDLLTNDNNLMIAPFKIFFPLISGKAWPILEREFNVLCSKNIIQNSENIELCKNVFQEFNKKVLSVVETLEQGIIHSDVNETNVLLQKSIHDLTVEVSGLIDFGDSHWSARVLDVSNTILYLFLDFVSRSNDADKFEINYIELNLSQLGKHFLSEYLKIRKGGNIMNEIKLIGISMKARILSSVLYSMHVYRINYRKSSDWVYIKKTQESGWKVFKALCKTSIDNIFETP